MKASLTVTNVTKEQTGFYTCKAKNDFKEETTKAKLDLTSTLATSKPTSVIETAITVAATSEVTESVTAISEITESVKATSEFTESTTVKEASKTKSEKKVKSHKKVARSQKAVKEESKTELIVTQTQKQTQHVSEEEIEEDEDYIEVSSMNQAHLEVVRESSRDERVSDANSVKITTKTRRLEDDDKDVEIIEETEEIHVKIYKEVFSAEELESFKVADEVNSLLESIEAHQFGSGERPLREVATVALLLKKGVEITEIIQLYDADFFPALKLPESQSALVQLVERQGYENLIAEILHDSSSDDEKLLASTVGFRAFMRMVEVTKTAIEEIITNFKFEDFVSQEWKHKEIKETEIVEVTGSHASSIRTEKISMSGNDSD